MPAEPREQIFSPADDWIVARNRGQGFEFALGKLENIRAFVDFLAKERPPKRWYETRRAWRLKHRQRIDDLEDSRRTIGDAIASLKLDRWISEHDGLERRFLDLTGTGETKRAAMLDLLHQMDESRQ